MVCRHCTIEYAKSKFFLRYNFLYLDTIYCICVQFFVPWYNLLYFGTFFVPWYNLLYFGTFFCTLAQSLSPRLLAHIPLIIKNILLYDTCLAAEIPEGIAPLAVLLYGAADPDIYRHPGNPAIAKE